MATGVLIAVILSAISIGKEPFGRNDWQPRICSSNICEHSWTFSESREGMYTYKILAKNENGQVVNDALDVFVVSSNPNIGPKN